MGVRYYLSGCAHEKAFCNLMGDMLRNDIANYNSIVFVAGNPGEFGHNDISSDWFYTAFAEAGMIFNHKRLIDYRTPYYKAKHYIQHADVVFMMGGDPRKQKKMCKKLGIYNMLANFDGVMIGMSAGAMLMSKYIVITPCSDEYPDFYISSGLNRDELSIFPHNNIMQDEYPESLVVDPEIYERYDLILVARDIGPFFLLQDVHLDDLEENNYHASFIRADDFKSESFVENEGRIWMATGEGIVNIAADIYF